MGFIFLNIRDNVSYQYKTIARFTAVSVATQAITVAEAAARMVVAVAVL
jgi:hypothetical protein